MHLPQVHCAEDLAQTIDMPFGGRAVFPYFMKSAGHKLKICNLRTLVIFSIVPYYDQQARIPLFFPPGSSFMPQEMAPRTAALGLGWKRVQSSNSRFAVRPGKAFESSF